ncbi:MAG: DUF1328 domain-containing protein [Chloroflexi bacterium]|nr:DUF1328 domain-containing protein [Chloroflexota bacterium]
MLRLASLFLIAALSAAFFGFSRLSFSEGLAEIARILFLFFFFVFLASLMVGIVQQNRKSGQLNRSK